VLTAFIWLRNRALYKVIP